MSKKTARKNRAALPQQGQRAAVFSPMKAGAGTRPGEGGGAVKRRALWLLAAVLIVSGYALLHKVDPGGQNHWAIFSPALLLGGYLLIIPAILYTYLEE